MNSKERDIKNVQQCYIKNVMLELYFVLFDYCMVYVTRTAKFYDQGAKLGGKKNLTRFILTFFLFQFQFEKRASYLGVDLVTFLFLCKLVIFGVYGVQEFSYQYSVIS